MALAVTPMSGFPIVNTDHMSREKVAPSLFSSSARDWGQEIGSFLSGKIGLAEAARAIFTCLSCLCPMV